MHIQEKRKYITIFEQLVALSKQKKLDQFLANPFHTLLYLLYTRSPFFIKKSLHGSAHLFFDKKIEGEFPDSVFSYLYLYGFLEEDLTRFLLYFLKDGMTFFDIGAHVGYFSELGAFLVRSSGSVHSFEATPRTHALLSKNMQQFDNATTNLRAVWSSNTTLDFFDYGAFYAQCNSFTKAKLTEKVLQEVKPEKLTIATVTVDSYCKEKKLKPDFIKIDAESAEYAILQGMKETLQKIKPVLSLEIGDIPGEGKKGSKDCIQFLEKFGYVPFEYKDGKMIAHTLRKNYNNVFDNLIFIPKNKKIVLSL